MEDDLSGYTDEELEFRRRAFSKGIVRIEDQIARYKEKLSWTEREIYRRYINSKAAERYPRGWHPDKDF